MICKALNEIEARRWLQTRLRGGEPHGGDFEVGAPPRGDVEERLLSLAKELDSVILKLDTSGGSLVAPQKFESRACALVHGTLGDLPLRIATCRDFWRYVSCGPLFTIIRWRYPDSETAQNYGIGERFKCVPERLWFRGHVAIDPSGQDAYRLARRGTGDFWNEIIKHTFGAHGSLVRTLVRFQFPEEGDFDDSGRFTPQTLSKEGLRTLMRHLQHFSATTEFTALSENECADLVENLAGDLPHARS